MKEFKDVSGGINWTRSELKNGSIIYQGTVERGEFRPEKCPECGGEIHLVSVAPHLSMGLCEKLHMIEVVKLF